ncbi:uncharacterized protein A4U43_C04F2210 [Asparagus officinalis]|uniref:Uncharacterized protein n=1 Tax=Asparagus officinalis TaxID=4686 RepID=A0A5P1EYB0_ASPOF|nr:uncharacterized protein A4U43_C04F2210 [Asparagus officinalis]
MARDWSELPQELLELIASKSDDISDHVRFGAVCTSWRSAAPNRNIRQNPWIRGYNIEASRCGWLLLEGGGRIFLFNPLAKAQTALPRFPTERRRGRILYAHVSSHPLSDDCVIVCRVESRRRMLLVCVPGDSAWSSIDIPIPPEEVEEERDDEIICREGSGRLPTIYCPFLNTTSRFFGSARAPRGTRYTIPYSLHYYCGWSAPRGLSEAAPGVLVVIGCYVGESPVISCILKVDYDQREITGVEDVRGLCRVCV